MPPFWVSKLRSSGRAIWRSISAWTLSSASRHPGQRRRATFPSWAYRSRSFRRSPTRTPYGGLVTSHPGSPGGSIAEIAARRGIDLWSYTGRAGGNLRAAIDRLAYYWFRPEEWPDHTDPTVPSTGPMWEIAYARYGDPRWQPIIQARRPYGDRGHSAVRWTTLTNGVVDILPIDVGYHFAP